MLVILIANELMFTLANVVAHFQHKNLWNSGTSTDGFKSTCRLAVAWSGELNRRRRRLPHASLHSGRFSIC
jgi:hypothetical protein